MKEEDIRPRNVFEEYLRLAAIDAEKYFGHKESGPIDCPACGSRGTPLFKKHGFFYEECPLCRTIFVSPRPAAKAFYDYYENSDSAKYFATTFYKATAESRREKLWKPKSQSVQAILKSYGAENHHVVDIGGGYGIFAEEYRALTGTDVAVIEPGPELAKICREKGLNVVQSFLEHVDASQLNSSSKAFISFELFEHLHDPEVFLKKLCTLMQKNDLFIFTTLSGTGLDVRVLWEDSNSISLQHLNFFNPRSIRLLAERVGLEILDVKTPGKLDMDILFNNKDKIKDRFWRLFMDCCSREDMQIWQEFIANQGWSSHMWVVCRKP